MEPTPDTDVPAEPISAGPHAGPLAGLRVLDLTRILAGPTCTQLLGDLGAQVIKVERPGAGDDTRKWGPPYVTDADGNPTKESAYYLCANRNKRSVTIDLSHPEGQALVRRLAAESDILVENYKVGGLAKYGLDFPNLSKALPRLVYCSITGFGQTGPYAPRAGYDFLAQGLGGIMSLTGEIDGEPMKIGVGIADIVCGLYASTAILAALRHRDETGRGQHIDLALLDTQVSWLANEGCNYLLSGKAPVRRGNGHPNIVPYQTFPTADGTFILAVGNDGQFARFCRFAGLDDLIDDTRFATNPQRIAHREDLIPLIAAVTEKQPAAHWLDGLEGLGVPCGAVNTVPQTFEDPQVLARGMRVTMPHAQAGSGTVDLIANPIKLSDSPVTYRHGPPVMGQDTDAVLSDVLGLDAAALAALRDANVI
ncbi:MAG: CoA transferase [Rhodobacterales bacterium]|nr:CoA transferase [Rhodobacterales bacterium]